MSALKLSSEKLKQQTTSVKTIDLRINKKEFEIFNEDCTCIIDEVEFVKIIDSDNEIHMPLVIVPQPNTTPRKAMPKFHSRMFNRLAVLRFTLPLYLMLLLGAGNVWGQTTIFTETIGTCCTTTNTAIASTTFDNSGFTFSGTADTRTSTASSGYTGATGGRNVYIANVVGRDFMISGINTTGYTSLTLSFGHFKSTTAANNELVVEVSSDGTNWTALSYSRVTGTGTATWILITPTGTIPATANLRIRFRQTSATPQFRVDDIKLVGTAAATAPAAPTISSITPSNQQLSVAFTAGSDGGSALTNYKYSTNGGTNWQTRATGTTASPLIISTLSTDGSTALTNGTSYNIQIRAVNAVGDGTATASTAGTPRTTPSAPTITGITPGNQQLSVAFTAGSDGGSSITTYKYSTNGGTNWQTRSAGTTASPLVISTLSTDGTTALTNGVSYDIQIRAVNSAGDGTATTTTQGTPSAPVSPTLNVVILTTALSSTYGIDSTGVSFTASGSNLTGNITATAQSGYEVSTSLGSGYDASVSVSAGTTVYVRFSSTRAAGTYNSATAVVLSGGGASSSANVTTSSSGNTVSQKALTVTGLTAQNKVYDGLTTATATGTAAFSGVIGADAVSLTGTPIYTFVSANVGTSISVSTSGYSLTGGDAGNYTLTQPTLIADITARSLTITANDVSKNSGVALSGGAGSIAFTSSGLQNGQTIGSVTISYGSASSATGDGLTPGVYSSQVTPSAATGGTFNSANYSISYVAGSITVTAAPEVIAIQDFETIPATPTLGYQSNASGSLISGASGTGDRPASSNYFISSNTAWNANNTSSILTFSNVTGLGSYISKYYEFRLASYSNASTGNGADATDIATVEVSLDGGTNWSSELRVLGNANAYWNYSATGLASITYDGDNTPSNFQPAGGGSRTTDGYSTIKINLSDISVQARLRITLLNNATGERWVIDDVKLTGTINTSPNIIISQTSLSSFSQNSSTPSSEQSYTVSSDNLTNDVTITPPAGYEISTSTGGSFSATNPITLFVSSGNIVGEPVSIYVRQSSTTLGNVSGNITHSSTGANSPNVAVSGTRTGSYYSKATGNLDDNNSWGSNTDGSGSTPSNFSTDGIIYEIRNRTTATIGANWTVTGTASKVLVGDGTNSTDFTIPSGFVLTGTIDVSNFAELTIENTTAPTFGTFATNSTLEYKDLPITLSTSTTYKNLKLTGSGTKTFPGGTTNVTGNLILTNTAIDGGSGPFSTISLSGDLTYVGTVTPPVDANSITLSTNGTAGGTQTITGAGNTLRWFRIQATTANTILLSTSGGSSNLLVGNSSGGGITLVDGSILDMNGSDFTLFSSLGTSTAFLINTTASISTTSATDLTIERTGNGNLGTLRFTSGSNTIGNLTLKHIGITNNLLTLESALAINGTLTLTNGVLSVGANSLSINGNLNRTSGFIDASNASASVVFAGSSSQNIPASTFTGNISNLTLNNGSGLSTSQNLTIASGLSLTSGTLTVGASTLTLNGSINQTSGNIDASNATSTVVFGGSSAQLIPASTFTGNINNLTLSNSAGLTINQDLSINSVLNLANGRLTLGNYHLTLGESATTSGTFSSNNMIVATGLGELRKRFTQGSGDIASFTFPVGNSGEVAEYTPIVLDFASGNYGANSYVGVRVQDSKQATLNSSVTNYLNRNWIVEPNDITGYSYKIQLYYVDADFITDGSMSEGDLKPIKISSGQWYQPTDGTFTNALSQGSAGIFASSNYLEWNNLTTFSEFGGAGGSNQPLPIELLSFNAICLDEQNILTWQTASEQNSSHFDIEKSRDGEIWNVIGKKDAAGNSNELLTYQFVDAEKNNATIYYRLNQVDFDGKNEYFGPVTTDCDASKFEVSTLPNPSNDNFWVKIQSNEPSSAVLSIVDVKGNNLFSNEIIVQEGINLYQINSFLDTGIYFIHIYNSKDQKITILKHLQN
jgi:predicted RNA-binding protein with TRAM domain